MISNEFIFLIFFIFFIVFVLLLDLLIIGKKSHIVSLKEATIWSIVWITLAMGFSLFLYFFGDVVHGVDTPEGLNHIVQKYAPHLKITGTDFAANVAIYRHNMTIDYLSGYLIEKTLSVDNLFVMIMILNAFSVKLTSYKPVLFWGIIGAVVLRFIFIFAGALLIQKFEWTLIIFGAYLIYAGIKMYINRNKDEKIEPQNHPVVKFLSKRFRVFSRYVGNRFFLRRKGVAYVTPLFIVLIFVEFTDLIFATDSIPAIFSITKDPYVVFFSNIFAILGLRSLFFLLVHIVKMFHYLKIGIAILLVFVGVKLIFNEWLTELGFKSVYSLYFILIVLAGSIVFSLLLPKGKIVE